MSTTYYSPLRYPGGKGTFSYFLAQVIMRNPDVQYYAEPYAGGAAAALSLLINGYVKEIYLNDKDIFIYSFWKAMKINPDEFISRVQKTPVTIDEWKKQKEFYSNPSRLKTATVLDIGFCTFFLNRCNRSGILSAGPIGGKEQNGKWKIDVRFNKQDLVKRLEIIKKLKNKIHLNRGDAIDYMRCFFQKHKGISHQQILFYLDPPYYLQGKKLYKDNYYIDKDHLALSKYLYTFSEKWLLSYDDNEFIRDLYPNNTRKRTKRVNKMNWAYYPKMGREIILASKSCKLPSGKVKLSKSLLLDARQTSLFNK
jgi:DNA adenine methylase